MSINENQEFETINRKANDRTETYREAQMKKKARAVACILGVAAVLGIAVTGFWALEEIEWINHTFRIVLTATAGAVAMFKIGGFWREIEK